MTLNLTWADHFSEGVLIDLMVGVALRRVASDSLERLLHENELSEAQLLKLSKILKKTTPGRDQFRQSMLQDTYMVDQNFFQLSSQEDNSLKSPSLDNVLSWAKLLPQSYWESERKVYVNMLLSQLPDWTELARPSKFDDSQAFELMPWSFTARDIAPRSNRAQAQFMVSLSYFTALRIEVTLQLYHHHHGEYPGTLKELVPDYLDAVPVDAAHPHLWKRKAPFTYKHTAGGYSLVSESPVYEMVGLKQKQIYGPYGSWKEPQER